jgi:glutamine synthetase
MGADMSEAMSKKDVLKEIEARGVKFVRLWFTDVLGSLKSVEVVAKQLDVMLEEGAGFDGSSVEGYARIEESDMIAMPDTSTFSLLPWGKDEGAPVARMFCDIQNPDGTPYAGDPRGALKVNLAKAAKLGYKYCVGPELEYFYFSDSKGTECLDKGGYFELTAVDVASNLRRDTVLALGEMGIEAEYSHHEVAPSQHEIDLRYGDALDMADAAMTYRLVVKEVAMRHGVYATFMPKPMFGENGSGMHVHQSLFRTSGENAGRNAFFDPDTVSHLSQECQGFIAGLLKHSIEMTAVVAQWINSYKRLVPGYEAPVYVAWGQRNRSSLVRVPMYKPGKENATRVEYRSPDPACNPYLAFSVMLAAGLKGMDENYDLPVPVEDDIYGMDDRTREESGIECLPGSLDDALAEVEKSELVRDALGQHIFEKFIENKRIECEQYRRHVSDFEIEKYLPVL